MKRLQKTAAIGAFVLIGGSMAYGAGGWFGLPQIGGPSYCISQTTPGGPGTTPVCTSTAPAGPTAFTGTEMVPTDITGNVATTPATAYTALVQLGQGPMIDLTTVGTAQTIPNATPFYFLDGAQASALTVTMPPNPVEGQIQNVVCESATVGALTVAANTGQTLKGNPAAACVAGVGYRWRYQLSTTTWYRF
jgi:hypothetical protein